MSPGFLFGCKYKMIFSKELQKSDEKPIKLNANVCIAVQNVWEYKTCEYDISAWYIENKKQGCNLHTFAYETLFFDEILFCDLRIWRRGYPAFGGLFQNFHRLLQTSIHSRSQGLWINIPFSFLFKNLASLVSCDISYVCFYLIVRIGFLHICGISLYLLTIF